MDSPIRSSFAMALVLITCAGTQPLATEQRKKDDSTKACRPAYLGKLVVSPDDDGRKLTLVQPYSFKDSRCTVWMVPAKAKVDGASIPQIFWSLLGGPFDGKYRNASVIHDWFCDRRTRPWQRVHRVFYEAMLASGVEPKAAKLMYLAVYYRGPRWDAQALENNRLVNRFVPLPEAGYDSLLVKRYHDLAYASDSDVSAGVDFIADQIELQNIDLDQIDRLAEQARAKDGLSDALRSH